jgi:hypothetical protein
VILFATTYATIILSLLLSLRRGCRASVRRRMSVRRRRRRRRRRASGWLSDYINYINLYIAYVHLITSILRFLSTATATASIGIVRTMIKALYCLKEAGVGRGKVELLRKSVFKSYREACLKVVNFNHILPFIAFRLKEETLKLLNIYYYMSFALLNSIKSFYGLIYLI